MDAAEAEGLSFRPARGARIETMRKITGHVGSVPAFAPHAGRGLKRSSSGGSQERQQTFAPHAGRGLKLCYGASSLWHQTLSPRTRGAD